MSALTKLFVVLLIVCSLLLTAAVVVFVNQSEDWRKANQTQAGMIDLLRRQNNEAQAAKAAAEKGAEDRLRAAAGTIQQLNTSLTAAQADLAKANNDLAAAKTTEAMKTASIAAQATALETAQKNLGALQDRHTAVVGELDKQKLTTAETIAANTDLTKRLDATEAERRWANEQVIQLQKDVTTLQNTMAEKGIALTPPAARSLSVPPAQGVVMEVKKSDGQTYATVNIGSSARLQKGMQLKVTNQAGTEFLAYFTVDTVEPNESWGRLEGPKVAQVDKDCKVIGQL